MRTIVVALLGLLISSWATPAAAQTTVWPSSIVKVWAQRCRVAPATRYLSGARVDGFDGYLTALHGVAGCGDLRAWINSKQAIAVDLVMMDLDHDIALLRPRTASTGASLPKGGQVSPEQKLTIIGFPNGSYSPFFHTLHVTPEVAFKTWDESDADIKDQLAKRKIGGDRVSPALNVTLITLQGPVAPGHSGAPITNRRGEVVAIAMGALTFGTTAFAVPIASVRLVERKNVQKEHDMLARISPQPLYALEGHNSKDQARERLSQLGIKPERSELLKYAETGGLEEINLILRFVGTESRDPNGPTALTLAAAAGHLDVVRSLVAAGANRAFTLGKGGVPEAAVGSGKPDVVAAILGFEKQPGSPGPSRDLTRRSLHLAIEQDRADIVQLVLANDTSARNIVFADGETPLHVAAKAGAVNTLVTLLAVHPSVVPNASGRTPFDEALHHDRAAAALLLSPGPTHDGCTLLGIAARRNAGNVVAAFAKNTDPNEKACGDDTALIVASKAGADAAESALLANGAFVKNPHTGELPKGINWSRRAADKTNNLRLRDRILAGAPLEERRFQLRGLETIRTELAGGLLSAAAFALDVEIVEAVLKDVRISVRGRCIVDDLPDTAANLPLQAVLAGAAGVTGATLDAAKKIVDMLLAHEEELARGYCGEWTAARLAARNLEILKHFEQTKVDLGYDWRSTALVEAILADQTDVVRYLVSKPTAICRLARGHFKSHGFIFGWGNPQTAVFAAVFKDDPDLFTDLAKRIQKEQQDKTRYDACEDYSPASLLTFAACNKRAKVIGVLVSELPQVNRRVSDVYERMLQCLLDSGRMDDARTVMRDKNGMIWRTEFNRLRTPEAKSVACEFYATIRDQLATDDRDWMRQACRW